MRGLVSLEEAECDCGYKFEDLRERLGLTMPRSKYGLALYECRCGRWYEVDALCGSGEISLLETEYEEQFARIAFPFIEEKQRKSLTPSERFDIMSRDKFRCQLCGATAKHNARLEVDHKIPVKKGGTNDPDNLWTLCFSCNRGKAAKELDV